jgi:hypothetical protein
MPLPAPGVVERADEAVLSEVVTIRDSRRTLGVALEARRRSM